MKKYLILILATAAALVSCGKGILGPGNGDETVQLAPVTFNLTATHPDATKAVKSDWEDGDAFFVFFDNVAAPKHLKMTFDGTSWTSAEYDGATITPGALGLKNGDNGTMRAVFLPFGSDATVSADGTSFTFSKIYYAYYLTATLSYTVTDNEVSGAFNMVIPEGYVQFFVEEASASDEAYILGCDAVIPVGVASIGADGTITETSDKSAADDMPGYAYSGGYLFSGKLNTDYHSYRLNGAETVEANAYYFAKTKVADNTRADYFVSGEALASKSAVKLPANDNVYALQNGMVTPNKGKWIPVGSGISVTIGNFSGSGYSEAFNDCGTWQTCNYGSTTPEGIGTKDSFYGANGIAGITLPTRTQCETIINGCSWTVVTIHGQIGMVVHPNSGCLFLPMRVISPTDSRYFGQYWTSSTANEDTGYYLDFVAYYSFKAVSKSQMNSWRAIRAIQN